jgi:hypothetical protein
MIVAEAGPLSEKNIEQLDEEGYEYIVGARIAPCQRLTRRLCWKLPISLRRRVSRGNDEESCEATSLPIGKVLAKFCRQRK